VASISETSAEIKLIVWRPGDLLKEARDISTRRIFFDDQMEAEHIARALIANTRQGAEPQSPPFVKG